VASGKRSFGEKREVIMDLRVVATRIPAASVARAASHLSGRQVVPALVIVTALLLTLAILFGPDGPLSAPRRLARRSRAASQPVDTADR
jgi:hypothetical protein